MKKNIIKAVCGIAVGAMVMSVTVPSFATSLQEAEKKQKEIEENLADSQSILDNLNSLKSDADAYVTAMDEKLSQIEQSIVDLQQQQETKQREIDETKAKLAEQEADIEEQYNSMKKRIQFMFENGNTFYIEIMFGTEDISDLLNKAEYISMLEEYDRNMLNKMKETQEQIEESKKQLENEQSELNKLVKQTEEEQKSVEELIAAKQAEIESYNTQIQDTQAQIEQQQKELEEEQQLIEEMKEIERQRAAAAAASAAQGSTTTSFVSTGSGFIWPVSSHTISSEYGYRTDPINGTTSYHSGVDIAASSGTPISAVADGEVAWSYYSSSAGNWIGIDHGDGVYSVYMHCSLSIVSPGDIVSQGDVIGYVGSTGRSTGPHLHLSIRLNGEYVDPHQYVGY